MVRRKKKLVPPISAKERKIGTFDFKPKYIPLTKTWRGDAPWHKHLTQEERKISARSILV
jgi:hypothetical protein